MVDLCLSLDPRIKKHKAEEKAAREAKRKGGVNAPVDLVKKAAEEKKLKEEQEKAAAVEKLQAADDKVRTSSLSASLNVLIKIVI